MTEDEAKTKWCPFVRYADPYHGQLYNRWSDSKVDFSSPKVCRCIASDCMAWRWNRQGRIDHDKNEWFDGYCGLAGGVE